MLCNWGRSQCRHNFTGADMPQRCSKMYSPASSTAACCDSSSKWRRTIRAGF
jgi:hypothetical protein